MPEVSPPYWTTEEFARQSQAAINEFRKMRVAEPLEQYLNIYHEYSTVVESILVETGDLRDLVDRAVEYLSEDSTRTAFRYLASPAVSEDDLKVLAEASLAATKLAADPEMVERVVEVILLGLDGHRFPWVGEDRPATPAERQTAVVSTTALIAAQRLQTHRRNVSGKTQEQAVADYLIEQGFEQVPTRPMGNYIQLPKVGQFCRETIFAKRKADLVVRLWDGRAMPMECKVSNSSTNSVKRLNNDAAAKAVHWIGEFGRSNVVPAAMLSGVYKVHNLEDAQAAGLTIFWSHNLDSLGKFLEQVRPG